MWREFNTAYRFIPSGPVSRFIKSELYTLTGTLLATTGQTTGADTATTTAGLLDINFPQQCPPGGSAQYVIKTYFSACTGTGQLMASDTITINPSSALGATATSTAAACGPNGTVTVSVPTGNGAPPYLMSIDGAAPVSVPGQTYTFTGLLGGPHTVVVSTTTGCTQTLNVNVAISGALTITAAATPPACSGASNGSITITPTNGVGPYNYSLNGSPFQPGNTFTGLPSGTYFVSVNDPVSGCFINNVFVSVGASTGSLNFTATPSGTSCTGVNNGSITINPTNGSAPYQYAVNGGAYQPGTVISSLAPGTYSVTVRDASGCTSAPQSIAITAGSAQLATTATTAASCNGVNNGTITVTPTNGSAPFSFSLDGGAFQSSNIFNGVSAGSHNVVVRDGAGCTSAAIPVTVAVGSPITGTAISTPTSCNGVSNGTITATPGTGTSPFQYSLDGTVFQASNLFTGLPTGAQNVIIRDAVGCTSAPIPVTVGVGAAITATVILSATSCSGASDGSVIVTPGAGAPPYQYAIDGGAFQSSNNFTGLASGNHTVVVRDGAGCTSASIPFTIAAGSVLTATAATTATSCNGAQNGSITVNTTNGNGPFQYAIDGVTFQSGNVFTGLASGNYTITWRNATGCQSTIQATVNAGQPLTGTVAVTNVNCNGGADGTATITVSGNGTAPFEYSLDGTTWQAASVFSGLAAGSYTAYFRDAAGCSGTRLFNVTAPAALNVAVAEQAVVCFSQSNGRIVINATGGTAPYQYSLDGVSYQVSNTFNVPAGSYTVYVRDANNCIGTDAAQISQPTSLSATNTTTDATCEGGPNGTITVTPAGGTAPYQYVLNGSTSFQVSNVFNVTSGSYTVTIRDANGCTTTSSAVVGLNNNLTVTPMPDVTICQGTSTQLSPVTNATQFSWEGAGGLSATGIRQPIATPGSTASYIVTATLGNCSAKDTVVVNVLPAPVPNAGPDGDICYGQSYTLQGSGGSSYSWTSATNLSSTTIANPVSTPTQTIQYSLHVTDANGCRSLQPDVVRVNVTPPIVVQISRDTVVAAGDVFRLFASSVATSYNWSPGTGLDSANIARPLVTVNGDITYTVTASTAAGCKGTASVTLKVYDGPEIYVPTAFTPNGDGRNDVFRAFPVGVKRYNYFRVFNRWGQVLFSTTDFNAGWDGTINGKPQPTGTYVWMIEGIDKNDRKITKRGTVTLIR